MLKEPADTITWPDLAVSLHDPWTSRNEEIPHDMSEIAILVPGSTGSDADPSEWVQNGTLKVATRDKVEA